MAIRKLAHRLLKSPYKGTRGVRPHAWTLTVILGRVRQEGGVGSLRLSSNSFRQNSSASSPTGWLAEPRGRPPLTDPAHFALRVSLKNSRGLELAGVLLVPARGGPHPVIVFAHGWGSGKDSPRNRSMADGLRAQGFASFLFDFTGHGESEGRREDSTQGQQVEDLAAALDVLETLDELDRGRMGVIGPSSGAAVALLLAATDPRIRALVLRSGNPAGAEEAASGVVVPTLLVVGEHDEPIRAASEELVRALGGPRSLEVVAGGDHLFEDPEALRQATGSAAAWFREHLR